MARVTAFGLNMADTTYADIMLAVRGTYPNETAGFTDAKAVQTVLKIWVVDLLARWHAAQAADPSDAARNALQQAIEAQNQAASAARNGAGTDIQITGP